jgi:ABC-type Na+ efflux pump permease subunit
MPFLPIVTRELRVASRRRATYWSRSLTAVVAIAVSSVVYANVRGEAPQTAGQSVFWVIAGMALFYCVVTGIRSTADCLSEEKREGTLGLLFLTDLKGYDVVGGKLVATSLNAFYGLTAIFPVLAIPLLMGGITNGEFWRMALVLANTFLFSLATGMFMSSICKSPRKAMAGTFILLLFFTIGLLICAATIPYIYRSPKLARICELMNPISAFGMLQDPEYIKKPKEFWWSFGILHAFCWVYLTLASLIVPRSWQDKTPGAKARRIRDTWHELSFGDSESRLAFRRRLLDINAFFWLAGRVRMKPLHVWAVLAGLAGLWIWGAYEHGRDWTSDVVYIPTAIILNTMLKLWVASAAGRRLGEDRKMGALELLLSTPLTVPDILRGQMLALRRQFLGPLIAVVVVECVFLIAALQSHATEANYAAVALAWWAAFMILLVADILALSAVGMWVSLTAKNPNRATGTTVVRVMIIPLAVSIGILIAVTVFNLASSGSGPTWKFFLAVYFVPGIVADVVFGLGAWRRLNADFRLVAVQRFTPAGSLWKLLFGGKKEEPPAVAATTTTTVETAQT